MMIGYGFPKSFRTRGEKEVCHRDECRTRGLFLKAWDRMEAAGEFTAMGM